MKRTEDRRMPAVYEGMLGAGVLLFVGMWLAAAGLQTGNWGDNMLMLLLCTLFGVLALLLLYRDGLDLKLCMLCALPVLLGMLLRIRCLDYSSGDYEDFLSRWLQYFRDNGGFKAIQSYSGDYNAPYLYVLAIISMLSQPELYLIKLFSILADVVLAWGGFRVVKAVRNEGPEDPMPAIAFSILMILPTVMANSAYWAQCDSFYGALILHAMAKALTGKEKTSAVLVGAAFAVKLQSVFLIPLWGVLWLAKRFHFRNLFFAPLSFIVLCLPAVLLGRPVMDVLNVYFHQTVEYQDRLVLNAPSVYQFIPNGAKPDPVSAGRIGIIAAFVLVLALMAIGLFFRNKLDNRAALSIAAVMAIGVPFFLPHMHERYFYLADIVMACLVVLNVKALPAAAMEWFSSMASYIVYLRLKYNFILHIAGNTYVMAVEAGLMLVSLIWAAVVMGMELARAYKSPELDANGMPLAAGTAPKKGKKAAKGEKGSKAEKKPKADKKTKRESEKAKEPKAAENSGEDTEPKEEKTAEADGNADASEATDADQAAETALKSEKPAETKKKPGRRLAKNKKENKQAAKTEPGAKGPQKAAEEENAAAEAELANAPEIPTHGKLVLPGADKLPEVWSIDMPDEDEMENEKDSAPGASSPAEGIDNRED